MSRVLVTGARAPVAVHLARVFRSAGWEVILADTLKYPLAKASRTVSRYYRLAPPDHEASSFLDGLAYILDREAPDLVVPTCEEVFYLAWAFETLGRQERLFAPSLATLRRAHSKSVFAEDAEKFGLFPPATRVLASQSDLTAVAKDASSLVFKPVWSRFASSVLIRPSSDSLSLQAVRPSLDAPWLAQEFISGEELCCYAVARGGHLICRAAYRPKYRAGRGAGIYFEPVHDDAIDQYCAAYIKNTGWTGQISFDFRRDATGRLRTLECNPRATSGVHFFGPEGGLADAISRGGPAVAQQDVPLMIPAAMVLYALPFVLREGAVAAWLHDFRRAQSAMVWHGDRLPALAQPLALIELVGHALKARSTLIHASTTGIAWDGGAMGNSSSRTGVRD